MYLSRMLKQDYLIYIFLGCNPFSGLIKWFEAIWGMEQSMQDVNNIAHSWSLWQFDTSWQTDSAYMLGKA